jgi:hypothetical protein
LSQAFESAAAAKERELLRFLSQKQLDSHRLLKISYNAAQTD